MAGTDMTTRILKMYETLSRGKEIYKLPFCLEYGISERTFERDVEKIRLFLSEEYTGKKVEYNSDRACYIIPGSNENGTLSIMEITIIVKMLKGERLLEKREFEGLLQSIQRVAEPEQKVEAAKLIQAENSQYKEKKGQEAFLQLFADLQKCIAERNMISFKTKQEEKIRLFPVAVEYLFSEFYLLGYKPEAERDLTVFRLNDIESIRISIQKYKKEILEQYSYQEGRGILESIHRELEVSK